MRPSDRPAQPNRRAFLTALGVVPVSLALASCSTGSSSKAPTGPDLSQVDDAVRLQDDLYRHINGKWLDSFQLPPDKTSVSTFSDIDDHVQDQLRAVLDKIHDPKDGTDEQRMRDIYDARMDTAAFDTLGMTPLQPWFDKADQAVTRADLAKLMGQMPIAGVVGIGVSIDAKDSTKYVPEISQSGPGITAKYYSDPAFAKYLAAYRTLLQALATGAGFPDPAGTTNRLIDLETKIAAAFWDPTKTRDADLTYNPMSWDQLVALGPGFDWDPWLAGTSNRPKELFARVVVGEPSFITAIARIWTETDEATWREYLKMAMLRKYAKYLKKDLSDANFEYLKATTGVAERPELWKSAVGAVDNYLGEPLGKLYVDAYFPADAKNRAKDLVNNLLAAYHENFANSSWMSPATRDAAIAKLNKITVKIGYPDKWRDYSGLKITRGKLIESVIAVELFESQYSMNKLGNPVDKSEWGMTPQTVNAYYEASSNSINFPAGILQAPAFDKDAAAAVNYGAIGAIIGHEIGHGFDDQGSKYDGDGNRVDWWTQHDKDLFQAKVNQLIAQYNGLVPAGLGPDQHVNGQLTVGENLADLRGLMISLAAYRIAEKKDDPDYTAMFQSWARYWREKQTPEALEQQLANDPHSPGEFRCNQVVRNLPEFYRTFGVTPSDKLFLAEDQRVSL
ncbi:M13 family metallopeptidase [Nocardia stercoris]|uniref:M13 family peptidase n=1 Tax=Nocardia stercoris TaxID=2483361 RepID=A0A3M2L3D0_9NOCA|nr:M13 family metallopeptidase [Nocardia stercoris]RMI31894.1 M13 family peptidase [Nocardia stercoris]